MKAKINIRELLEDYAAYGTMTADVRIAIDDLMQCLAASAEHEFDIDIHELLARNRQNAPTWRIGDEQEVRPDYHNKPSKGTRP